MISSIVGVRHTVNLKYYIFLFYSKRQGRRAGSPAIPLAKEEKKAAARGIPAALGTTITGGTPTIAV
jgi:hypothetical protein